MSGKLNVKISKQTQDILDLESVRTGFNKGKIVDGIISDFFNLETKEHVTLKRVEKISAQCKDLQTNLNTLSEAFLIFLRSYFSRLSSIPADQKKQSQDKADILLKKFLETLAKSCADGDNLFNSLPRAADISEEELDEVVSEIETENFYVN
jgi:hypothetical protein